MKASIPRQVTCLLLTIYTLIVSLGAQAQVVSSKSKKPTQTSASAKRTAALAAREKAKRDSSEAVLALARKIAQEYIAADSVKKAHAAGELKRKQEEPHPLSKDGLSKKELKKLGKEEKLAEEKRKKALKDEQKEQGKSSKSSTQALQTYAILPFDVKIEKNLQMKKTTPEMLEELQRSESTQYQNGVFQFLMKRKKDYAVNFQDIEDTNTMLSRGGVTSENLKNRTKEELCTLLKVDGIVHGKFYRKEALDQNLGKAINMVASRVAVAPTVRAGDADLSLTLYNAAEKRVTWTYHNDDWNGMKDQQDITERLMQKAAKKFPFKK